MFTRDVGCGVSACRRAAEYKIAAPWSYGRFAELKSYGLACADHRDQVYRAALDRAREHQPSPEEVVGSIGIYVYEPGRHDRDLERLTPGT